MEQSNFLTAALQQRKELWDTVKATAAGTGTATATATKQRRRQ